MVVTDKIARKHVIVKTREVVTISQEHAIVHPDGGVQSVTNPVLLELMEASVSQLVNAKMEDLVILCLENATAQKDGPDKFARIHVHTGLTDSNVKKNVTATMEHFVII